MVMKLYKLFSLIFLFFFNSLSAQNISVSAYTDSTDYLVGDLIKYTIELNYDKGIEPTVPSIQDSLGRLEFISADEPVKIESSGKITERYNYTLSLYDSAEVTIPAIPIEYIKSGESEPRILETNPVTITVHTIEVDPSADIRDVKEPVKIPFDWVFWGLIILACLILAVLAFLCYKYYKSKQISTEQKIVKIVEPPHKIALRQLSELEEKKLWQQGNIKDYHSEITFIIRKYFERRFNFLAMEMTSNEIMTQLRSKNEARKIFDETRKFFENADLVKFAKFEPMPSVNEEMMKQAYEIVKQTKVEEEQKSEEVKNV